MGRNWNRVLARKCKPFEHPIAHKEWGGGEVKGYNRIEEFWRNERCMTVPVAVDERSEAV